MAKIFYFSYTGKNKKIAQEISFATGISRFEIVPTNQYSSDYSKITQRAKKEIFGLKLPSIEPLEEVGDLNLLILISPLWYADLPIPVVTFLSKIAGSVENLLLISNKFMTGFGTTNRTINKYFKPETNFKKISVKEDISVAVSSIDDLIQN